MRRNGAMLGILILVVAGCMGGERYTTEEHANKVEAPLLPATHFQVVDIPVPAVFRFDRKNSVISKSTTGRSANLVYRGRVHIERAANFYSDHMPGRGWKHQKTQVVGSRYILEFIKGKKPERCQVIIEKAAMGSVRATVNLN